MLLLHNAPRGCFVLVNILKQWWVESCICRWVVCVCCYDVSELGGCCPTLTKFFGVWGFLVCDGIPTPSKRM